MNVFLLICLTLLTACMKTDLSPEAALKEFIDTRIGKVIDRSFVLERVTGKMRQSFENMTDQDFEKFADMKNIQSDSFKILSKSCQDKHCFITYSITYKTLQQDKAAFTSEVKKIAEIKQIENKWLIEDVSNIKTYHESLNPLNPLE